MAENGVELHGKIHAHGNQYIGWGQPQNSILVGVNVLLMIDLPVLQVSSIVELAGIER